MSESLWTTADVSRYLSVSHSWVYREAKSGHLPSIRMAGVVRFQPEAIKAYARANARGAAQQDQRRPTLPSGPGHRASVLPGPSRF